MAITLGSGNWDKLPEQEKKLRELLFFAHGNKDHYLYGDDGEMWCNTCMINFKADSVDAIETKTSAYYLKNYQHCHSSKR